MVYSISYKILNGRKQYIETKEKVYQDKNQKIDRIIAHFDGFDKEYFVSDHGKRAALLAIRNGKVLIVRQYRLIINDLSYEIPGGRIDENASQIGLGLRIILYGCFH